MSGLRFLRRVSRSDLDRIALKETLLKSHKLVFGMALLIFSLLVGCDDDESFDAPEYYPVRFAVFSDPHYYDPLLGTEGEAFESYLSRDRKMLKESQAIFDATVESILSQNISFVLVAGDLSKDGERQCHEQVALRLAQLVQMGKPVYVVPGNHDISNPFAVSYPIDGSLLSVPSVTKEEFAKIYADFGFNEALYRDPNSLSYVAEAAEWLWVIAIDSANYNNRFADLSMTAGRISEETMLWLEDRLVEAERKKVRVVGLLHHAVVEHFPNMETVFDEYILDGWNEAASNLSSLGMNLVFTGHGHANDISVRRGDFGSIFDIETGSGVTWPSPYRVVHFDPTADAMEIFTTRLPSINFDMGGVDFQTHAHQFLLEGLPDLIIELLVSEGMDEETAILIEPFATATIEAYYAGDESENQETEVIQGLQDLVQNGELIEVVLGTILLGIWNDSTPDNNARIDLTAVTVTEI